MKYFLFIYSLPHVKWHGQPLLPLDLRTAHVELDRLPHVKWHAQPELQKVNTFTQAAFLGSKNLPQKCVIHDNFSPIKSA